MCGGRRRILASAQRCRSRKGCAGRSSGTRSSGEAAGINQAPPHRLRENIMAHTALANKPEEEILIIRPTRGWGTLNLRDLWIYRELVYFLTWRDLKVRYKQTALGAAWATVQP